jgi:diaminohydroxyphosphoribosylaminopyrimidine deaminase/5-amino-6-(5-phosphoribosylamino)uracil reductase
LFSIAIPERGFFYLVVICVQNEEYMERALRLAKRGRPWPNPYVGAVVVKAGQIIGEGYHPKAGQGHAEVYALRDAGEKTKGATLYVTLEPCCHRGRTGPCTDAILEGGIGRVVAAMEDPNPKVSGRGLTILRKAGLQVEKGVLEKEARQLNEVFLHTIAQRRPFFTLKLAQSLDGKIATKTGQSRWITGRKARDRVHRLRDRSQAIMVGSGTVHADNPLLNTRIPQGHNPIRIIVDTDATTPTDAKLWSVDSPVIVATAKGADLGRIAELERAGAQVLVLPRLEGKVDLKALATALFAQGIVDVLVEGGATLAAAMARLQLVDKFHLFLAPLLIGDRAAPGSIGSPGWEKLASCPRFRLDSKEQIGEDLLLTLYPEARTCLQV